MSDERGAGALTALIHGFRGADTIAFSAQFALWCGRAGALFAGTGLGFRQFLALAGETGFADGDAGATGAFGATLAAIGLAVVGVAFARPLVLLHPATGTCRRRNRFPQIGKRWSSRSQAGIVGEMSGITFMVDSRGEKTAAVIDLRRHRKLWEDFYDTVLVESRAEEPRESLESVKRRLKLTKAHG